MSGAKANKPGRPWWRPLVDGIDGRITPLSNAFVRMNVFVDAIAMATRLEARLRRRIERQSTWLLHRYHLSTAEDVRSMRAQISAAEARLRDLAELVKDMQLRKTPPEQE
jgi:hypothetical protein